MSSITSKYVNIFEYAEFRRYLAEYQAQRNRTEPSFTRTEFC
ncbi:MAG: TIGR02147 family protein, partial [Fibrobacteraceae bacterium]|nr:TIGR02147 family protein [Fibrobacteraceae bacterium]